jgi:hypothetical protein
VQLLGQANPGELRKHGISPEHLLRHFILRNEFIFKTRKLHFRDGDEGAPPPSPEDDNVTRVMTILDVKNIRFTDITSDVIK